MPTLASTKLVPGDRETASRSRWGSLFPSRCRGERRDALESARSSRRRPRKPRPGSPQRHRTRRAESTEEDKPADAALRHPSTAIAAPTSSSGADPTARSSLDVDHVEHPKRPAGARSAPSTGARSDGPAATAASRAARRGAHGSASLYGSASMSTDGADRGGGRVAGRSIRFARCRRTSTARRASPRARGCRCSAEARPSEGAAESVSEARAEPTPRRRTRAVRAMRRRSVSTATDSSARCARDRARPRGDVEQQDGAAGEGDQERRRCGRRAGGARSDVAGPAQTPPSSGRRRRAQTAAVTLLVDGVDVGDVHVEVWSLLSVDDGAVTCTGAPGPRRYRRDPDPTLILLETGAEAVRSTSQSRLGVERVVACAPKAMLSTPSGPPQRRAVVFMWKAIALLRSPRPRRSRPRP